MVDTREIESAQEAWGKAVVEIGTAASPHEARALATRLAEDHYLIGEGNLLLCPTQASKRQFWTSLKGIVSYLVGGDPDHEEDGGFALEPWTAVRFENAGTIERADVGIAMGNYFFVRADGSGLKAEYSFAYVRGADGGLKIQLHHSAYGRQSALNLAATGHDESSRTQKGSLNFLSAKGGDPGRSGAGVQAGSMRPRRNIKASPRLGTVTCPP